MASLDTIDRNILRELQLNASLSNKELANRVGLAPSSCLERTRRLAREGVLLTSHATVDPEALGIGINALISVRLSLHTKGSVDAFAGRLMALPEVMEIYHLAGEHDFLIRVLTKDVQQLRDFALDELSSKGEVSRVETTLVFDHLKSRALPDYLGE